MAKAPAFQWYVKDWLSDPQLRMASHASKGIWIDMICFMWDAPARGELTGTADQLRRLVGATEIDFDRFCSEAGTLDFCTYEQEGEYILIRNRRMYREAVDRAGNRERQKRFREKGGGIPENWTMRRVEILRRDEHMCAYCGKHATTVDHILPKSKGGGEEDNNLVACCKSCNQIKNNRSLEEAKFTFWKGFDVIKLGYNGNITHTSPTTPTSPTPPPEKEVPNGTSSAEVSADEKVKDNCPHQKIIEIYHEVLPQCPKVRQWPPHLQKTLRARWNEEPERQTLEWWRRYFVYVSRSDFLTGKVKADFMADLEWLIGPKNFSKIANGRYHKGNMTFAKSQPGIEQWLKERGSE